MSNQKYTSGTARKQQSSVAATPSCSDNWTSFINRIRDPINQGILAVTTTAARNPVVIVVGVVLISIGLVAAGLFTNFSIDVNEDTLWTPMNSRPLSHGEWINNDSGFDKDPRFFLGFIHKDGDNVLSAEGIRRVFEALNIIRETEGYDEVCQAADFEDFNGEKTCPLFAVTNYWNNTQSLFESSVSSDEDAIVAISESLLPNGAPIDPEVLMGKPVFGDNGVLESATGFSFTIPIPEEDGAAAVEEKALEQLLLLRDTWAEEGEWVLQFFAGRSFSDEFTRAIVNDIPLVPIVFVIMSVFTCFIFWRRDWVNSRTLLGLGAVCTVFLAIMSGYGIMFIIGIPFTSMTQILPFIMFGIGLDNAFIISGEYNRTNRTKESVDRIRDTFDEVGLSIFLTTITSVVAFGLGCTSSVPAVYWLCLYAFPTILINFIFQLTFFVALIVIDEKRVQDKRRDCFVCCSVNRHVENNDEEPEETESWFDRFMGWYAELLFNNCVAVIVILGFTGLFGACAYSASLLTQEFQFTDVVPKGSYVASFWNEFSLHSGQTGVSPNVYFRNVDQCDPAIQEQMQTYVDELVALDEISEPPFLFWLRDFEEYVSTTESVQDLSCPEQVLKFLEVPVYHELYASDIVVDENGKISASRTTLNMDKVDQEVVTEQVDALTNQRRVTRAQPVNQGESDWKFFTFDGLYYIWQFYSVAPVELLQTTIVGIIAVTIIGLVGIPHWTSAFFVFPMITILYVDLLGVLQFAGLHVNAVSYVSLVMSIGLLVDFLMHVLLRYYEAEGTDRKAKVKETLKTMGASILVGAVSTFLGVIPLAFSTSEVFNTIFVTFVGLVTLGAGHGLILIPVLLSLVGPRVCIKNDRLTKSSQATKSLDSSSLEDSDSDSDDCHGYVEDVKPVITSKPKQQDLMPPTLDEVSEMEYEV